MIRASRRIRENHNINGFAARGVAQESDPGERIMNASCVGACHNVRAIQTAAMNQEAWGKTIGTMIEKGAKVSKEDVPVLVDYLAQHHGPVPEGRGKEILLNTCTMCHDLGMIVTAEGIETDGERDELARLGCDLMQGYRFARPGKAFPDVIQGVVFAGYDSPFTWNNLSPRVGPA